MLTNLPLFVALVFGLSTLLVLLLFVGAVRKSSSATIALQSNIIAIGLVGWLGFQAGLTMSGIYQAGMPPPKILIFGVLPALVTILVLFLTRRGRVFIDSLPLRQITYVNTVRVLVELVLYWLCLYKAVPLIMTFEGANFDILAGITAPIVAYFAFRKPFLSRAVVTGLLAWNVVCLGLLLTIVRFALLSAPTPFQQFGFEQPNIAIAYFPFSWLPTFIVPVILFGHLASIRQLWTRLARSSE